MASETFICKLDALSEDAYDTHGVSLVFCEIFVKRWSYVAGKNEHMLYQRKKRINERWGILHTGDLPLELENRIEELLKIQ